MGLSEKEGVVFLRRVDTTLHTMGKVVGDGGFKKMGDLSNGGMILEWERLIHPYDLCNFSDHGKGEVGQARKLAKKAIC